MHTRLRSQVFIEKYVVIFRAFRYASSAANFELTEMNNILKCLRGLINQKYLSSGGGGTLKKYKSVQGVGGGP